MSGKDRFNLSHYLFIPEMSHNDGILGAFGGAGAASGTSGLNNDRSPFRFSIRSYDSMIGAHLSADAAEVASLGIDARCNRFDFGLAGIEKYTGSGGSRTGLRHAILDILGRFDAPGDKYPLGRGIDRFQLGVALSQEAVTRLGKGQKMPESFTILAGLQSN